MDWILMLRIFVMVILFGGITYLYIKNNITENQLNSIIDFLDAFDDGQGVVNQLAAYAKLAVRAVEQLVKSGIIPKENAARKQAAIEMIQSYAESDALVIDDIPEEVLGNLVESEVYAMRNEQA